MKREAFSYIDVLTRDTWGHGNQACGLWIANVPRILVTQRKTDGLDNQSSWNADHSTGPCGHTHPHPHRHPPTHTHGFDLYRWPSGLIFLWSGGRHSILSCNIVAGRSWFDWIRVHVYDVDSASWHQPQRRGDSYEKKTYVRKHLTKASLYCSRTRPCETLSGVCILKHRCSIYAGL